MTSRFSPLALAIVAFGAACADLTPTAPLADLTRLPAASTSSSATAITVMAQNLYVGANVDLVIGALLTPDPNDDLQALVFAIQTLGNTDYPARAEAIADEIARTRPHAVGLQEVSDIDIELGPPFSVHLRFLDILRSELHDRHLNYKVAASVQNTDVGLVGGAVHLIDRDVLLVEGDVEVVASGGANFNNRIPPELVGGIELLRGWVWAQVTIGGESYRIVSLHAEANLAGRSLSQLRAGQMLELLGTLPANERTILMGDFNDAPGSLMYQVLQGAGFTDVWAAMRPGVVGNTCCHADDLSNPVARFSQRIDYVFARGFGAGPQGKLFGAIDRYGEVPADRVAGPAHPVWPSDHAGLVGTLR